MRQLDTKDVLILFTSLISPLARGWLGFGPSSSLHTILDKFVWHLSVLIFDFHLDRAAWAAWTVWVLQLLANPYTRYEMDTYGGLVSLL